MAETTQQTSLTGKFRPDGAWVAIAAIPVILAIFAPAELLPTLRFAGGAIAHTGVFILFAVFAVAYMKATGAENLLARAFEGREVRMIVLAALMGGLSPFCSCEVIPFIAALLAVGAPLSAVMAFWLASPLMDPAMFFITAGELGMPFALGKTAAAVGLGLLGGFATRALATSPLFANPLKHAPVKSCGCASSCSSDAPFSGKVVWRFWPDPQRRATFRATAWDNILFLGKWLLLAYLIEALMLRYIPADLIARVLGGDGLWPVVLGALVGAPAYLNGYAAVPMVAGLLDQGMSPGAAMSFVIAGGVSCIPAAVAVWALVKPRVFAAYLGLAVAGSIIAGLAWGAIA
ncbi:permease [Sinisalibacter aestuarii]|uniref:Transporter n=1 Tax=Sinisalibacter aestuarii TaxID=2949426 RepID=A0ABQ5LQ32_9RHOB|nr:permease [Sinisalibacter aestuarii]GKY87024.1 transporter [Sinisalibacter aestuarii]